jgi:hypothetical protein
MADMEERESEEVPNREDPSESEGGDEDEEDCEQPSKKKKKVNVLRQWNEVNRWNRILHMTMFVSGTRANILRSSKSPSFQMPSRSRPSRPDRN